MSAASELTVVRASEISGRPPDQPPWLVTNFFAGGGVGVIGGAPKCCKSWLSLDMAVAVASGRPFLGRFEVPVAGPVLVYAAEDPPVEVRDRLAGIAQARGADFASLAVGLIVEPCLRIDRPEDLDRLRRTVARIGPRLLILDPYVRLQRVDENNSTEVSAVLSSLREVSRTFEVAVVLVHHARKSSAEQAGQALRGSSDFHAWGDSNLYLARRGENFLLTIEHRAAAAPPSLTLRLVDDDGPVRLEIVDDPEPDEPVESLAERVLQVLDGGPPKRQDQLRDLLRVRNQRLTQALHQLERDLRIHRMPDGWVKVPPRK